MSSGDTLTYDMAQSTDKAAPSVFVKRDYLSILDSNNGSYNGNQIIIDTSQLSNSNKYMSYRQAYLSVPMVMAVSSKLITVGGAAKSLLPIADVTPSTRAISLKNWFGSIINSLVLDYAGTTIVQQSSLCGMWNCFTLMTSLSQSDIDLNGPSLGFFPDDVNWMYRDVTDGSLSGIGTCNNVLQCAQGSVSKALGGSEFGNSGMWSRMAKTIIDPSAVSSQAGSALSALVPENDLKAYYRSLVSKAGAKTTAGETTGFVYAIQAQIFLKHIHSFFANCPLMKGVFFRLTLNINQPTVVIKCADTNQLTIESIVSPLGGVSPIMVASQESGLVSSTSATALPAQGGLDLTAVGATARISLNVGNTILDPTQKNEITATGLSTTTSLGQSCQLYIPAYTFNPSYEEAYLSRPTKTIQYSDIYQFTTAETTGSFNFLISNGISNVKSILVLPYFSKIHSTIDHPVWTSPFDPAGAGPTSPLTSVITNFQVVMAGQNMFYNTQKYGFEQFLNQFVGVNSINGNLTDGLTSGLVDFHKFNSTYSYFFCDTSRKLPVDESVPMSISIQGDVKSTKAIKFVVFVNYGVQVSLDVLTGARV